MPCFADDEQSNVAGLSSESAITRLKTFRRIAQERKSIVSDLILVLNRDDVDTSFRGPLHMAIDLLGELRAEEAVGPLSKHLMFVPRSEMGMEVGNKSREHYYVSAVALTKIGQPAIQSMIRIVLESLNDKERNLAAWVIMKIEGSDQAIHRLHSLVQKNKNSLAVSMLEEAESYLRFYRPSFDPPSPEDQY